MNKITFKNNNQVTLWKNELLGQLSDGKWENATPCDHWQVWHRCEVVVGDRLGRDFCHVRKSNYNFSDKQFLNIVGQRMINSVRLTLAGYAEAAHHEFEEIGISFNESDGFKLPSLAAVESAIKSWKENDGNVVYWKDKFDKFVNTFTVTGSLESAIINYYKIISDESLYTKDQLLADLDDIKTAVKTVAI